MTNTALLLIDWQKAFRLPVWGERNNPDAEKNATKLIAWARGKELPVFHVKHLSETKGSPLAPDNAGCEVEDFAKPKGTEPTITKVVNSAFIDTDLEAKLKKAGISKLIVSGVSTDHCVSTSVRMAANLGFEVTLVEDACFTFDRNTLGGDVVPAATVHEVGIASLKDEFAKVVKTKDLTA